MPFVAKTAPGCLTAPFPSRISGSCFDLETLPGEAENTFETLGGFVMAQLGHIPAVADSFEWSGYRFEVMDMDGRRVDKVLLAPLDSALTSGD